MFSVRWGCNPIGEFDRIMNRERDGIIKGGWELTIRLIKRIGLLRLQLIKFLCGRMDMDRISILFIVKG